MEAVRTRRASGANLSPSAATVPVTYTPSVTRTRPLGAIPALMASWMYVAAVAQLVCGKCGVGSAAFT